MMSKCGKNKNVAHEPIGECFTEVKIFSFTGCLAFLTLRLFRVACTPIILLCCGLENSSSLLNLGCDKVVVVVAVFTDKFLILYSSFNNL